ncbi:Ig-like domain-containing protein [Gynuella sunshinyii]|uniref:SbsA Ig-like domain-containing protein n=1 Tax=Gynuella sunshinyii YC6258 TaxID=1445510 RepID=A0A0C5VT08_9GAMM|nr:Ig-like domain-containing protein [Gynuella sunshinyii]AJQ97321.1 hypothetical Protein YC6258_05291 [Gynuella sunshinyii YC6258]
MSSLFRTMLLLLLTGSLIACNSGSSGSGTDSDSLDVPVDDDSSSVQSVRISGAVSLSSDLAGASKPGYILQKQMAAAPKMKAASDGYGYQVANKPMISGLLDSTPLLAVGDALANAYVYLYDADHPEWLSPVAQDLTDSSGGYDFSSYGCTDRVSIAQCSTSAAANDNAYVDGDPLPAGTYTMLVYKPSTFDPIAGVTSDPIVAVLPAFKAEDESVTVDDMQAEVSDATPRVVTMFGKSKNTDGTSTWGSAALELPQNTVIQISFDMAMSRGSVQNIVVEDDSGAVSGTWSLSADWITATFEPDVSLSSGLHTVTVPETVANVYSNTLGYEAVGTFYATLVDNTAPVVTLNSPAGSTDVSANSAIRIHADEPLKLGKLKLNSEPSVGDFPGVMSVSSDDGYLYEFILTETLKLGTSYSYTISGIQDMAGNTAADITGTFTTVAATDADGVDDSATEETQTAQVAIADIFAKWVRGVNERNLAQIQSVLSGSFVFEYSVQAEGGFMDEDINRNGRLSQAEFMNLMEDAVKHWEFCDTTMSGMIGSYADDDVTVINNVVNIVNSAEGNFEFTLSFDSADGSQDCSGGPEETMYATVKLNNGAWKISRMSEGFDHRGTELESFDLLEAVLSEEANNEAGYMDITNGSTLTSIPSEVDPLTFRFEPATGTSSYILLLANVRDPSELGFAMVINASNLESFPGSSSKKSFTVPEAQGLPQGAVDVSELFGFDAGDEESGDRGKDWGIDNEGEVFVWEIIGMGSLTAADFSSTTNPVSVTDVIRDISSVSAVKKFKNPGERKYLTFMASADGSELTFNEYQNGYDAGSADQLNVTVTTPNVEEALQNGGRLSMGSDSGYGEYMLAFSDNGNGTASATVTLDLFQGWNWVDFDDGVDLYGFFQVQTTGGIAPAVTVFSVDAYDVDSNFLDTLTLNEWNFADAGSGATGVQVTWQFDTSNTDLMDMLSLLCNTNGAGRADIHINVWNESGAYDNVSYCENSSAFSINGDQLTYNDTLDIFKGDNWINLNLNGDDGMGSWFNTGANFGVYTDTGAEFVPDIVINTPTAFDETTQEAIELQMTGNWGQGSDWNGTAATADTDTVTISGVFADPGFDPAPRYHAGTDGAWHEEDIIVDSLDNSFSFDVTVYQGWNWISIEDGNGNWYNINIYTENGATVPKPEIVAVNGSAPVDNFGQLVANVTACTATVEGTAPADAKRLWVDWSGSNNEDYYWENQEVLLDGNDTELQTFSATFQVIGGNNAYNFINVYDEVNNTWAGVEVRTSDSSCSYTAPLLTITGVEDGNGVSLTDFGNGYGNNGSATTATTATISGTSTIPGKNIKLSTGTCGSNDEIVVQSATTANGLGSYNWEATINLYDYDAQNPSENYQWVDISDGQNWKNITIVSDSNVIGSSPISLQLPTGLVDNTFEFSCAYAEWDGTSLGTELTSVTINGMTESTQNGHGEYWAGNRWGTFEIESGQFSFEVELYDGYNWIHVNDADHNWYDIQVNTSNGNLPPQYIYITSPDHDSEDTDGSVTVAGDFGSTGFQPDSLWGYVDYWNPDTQSSMYLYFDSNLQTVNDWGDMPMTYNKEVGSFEFMFDLPGNAENVRIEVSGCGSDGCHGHTIWINSNEAPNEHFYKPGSVGSGTAGAYDRRKQHAYHRH